MLVVLFSLPAVIEQQCAEASEFRLCIINASFQFFDVVGVVLHRFLEPPHLIAELIVVKLAFADVALALTCLNVNDRIMVIALALALLVSLFSSLWGTTAHQNRSLA